MREKFLTDNKRPVNTGVAPPHNLDVEMQLLGSLLVDPSSFEVVAEFDSGQFFDPLHQEIFDAIAECIRNGRPPNPFSVGMQLGDDRINDLTPVQYVARLAANAIGASGIKDYARTLAELSTRRKLILLSEEMSRGATDLASALPKQIQEYESRVYDLMGRDAGAREYTSKQMMDKALQDIHEAMERGDGMSGLSTGLIDLDRLIGGLGPSNLIVLAGRPAMGKSALATNIAVNVAKSGPEVGFFSQEMAAVQLAMRVLGEHAGIASHLLRTGKVDPNRWRELTGISGELGKLPLTVDETGGLSLAALTTKARRWKRQKNIGLLVIDYIQLMRGTSTRGNRVEDVTEITTGLKALAKELQIPIIALSQLSRALENRENKRPQLSDLRESGSIEQDADEVLFVFREEYYIGRDEPSVSDPAAYQDWLTRKESVAGLAEVIAGKSRHGPTGIVKLQFDAHLTKFSDLVKGDRNADRH